MTVIAWDMVVRQYIKDKKDPLYEGLILAINFYYFT
tara:strand:+ start:205 stop:312 length:108 start_codon:yes stop_codon:yes gene_type:complete